MSSREAFLRRVRDLLASLDAVLTPSERGEVTHLIDHDEIGEALRTLAWIIVEEDKRIPKATYESILELSRGLVAADHMPENLAACVARKTQDE